MRKHQLKQIMDILKTLYDATAEMKSLLSRGDIGTVIGLLADCQDIALQIGESVEQVHGEGTKTVALLTNFCEELYRASIEVGRAGAKSDFVKRLRNALLAIESCAGDELKPDKLEIAFFPYKAAMWDSFESVWLAAKDDPRCDVHVVPIPYYDRLPGGKLGQAYFDGDQYPSYVPVEDWQKYDVEERRPDVIFIHNAYDGVNRITSLHPDYYAKRLCTLTDMLVYIPYFVCPGDFVPEHLSALPGLLHAHKAIAQNQSIRQSYIREYHEMEEQFGFAGRYGKAEEKFVALGSPKFDKALNAKPEDFELPEAWRRLIEKPDGTKKKAILYNTSISAILHHKEQYLRKLRHVLDMFERNGDVVLWWRPHPLSASTYQSAHPGLVEEYERITAQYRRKGFGIYDDTTDLHRALCLCSAYYGDSSSLEALFGVTGKPIVIQNPNIMDARHSLSFLSVAFDEAGNAYAWDTSYNGLFRLNFKDSSAKLIAGNDHYPGITPLPPYGVLGTHGDEIIAFPYFADEIFTYNMSNGEKRTIPLDTAYKSGSATVSGSMLNWVIPYNGSYYNFGSMMRCVFVYNAQAHTVRYDTKLFDMMRLNNIRGVPKCVNSPVESSRVALFFLGCDSLLEYELETQNTAVIASNPIFAACASAVFDGEFYWLTQHMSSILFRLDAVTGEIISYRDFPEGFQAPGERWHAMRIADCGGYLLLFPSHENMILRFDKRSGQFSEYTDMPVPDDPEYRLYKYAIPVRAGRKVYAFALFNHSIYELDLDSGKVTAHQFLADDETRLTIQHSALKYGDSGNELLSGRPLSMPEEMIIGNIDDYWAHLPEIIPGQKAVFLKFTARPNGDSGKEIMRSLCDPERLLRS